ncbi:MULTISPECIES: peroxiredoxin-like family protein [Roseivirga]|uniref:peroxiredoxin-like family protein n=1 Tax=Roseivirga TaxID=290180 RepID=UPI001B1FA347|nr:MULTISPECIES: peroxiredoxin-like family protein [Roseivirga]MBO6660142.1 AhpC/TSA family protein [Roseivirga sp.]MBO6759347.1 AhpC/TSA family protein [Roseivirga sp.]MBO6907121.1 AhpC/TSA family protein [Roseivirga sp.]WPZ09518.1 peroxiredoxin-like family protein [Roseivirga spongicola]
MNRPTPKHTAPDLQFPLLDGNQWNLADQKPDNFTLVVFYRGLHCPLCKKYLQQLQELLPEFEQRGVDIVVVSMDTEKRARLSRQNWELSNLTLGYGLTEKSARDWALYLSSGVKAGEPSEFSEPGLFLIDNKNEVYYSAINSNPWGRPYLPSFVKAVDYIVQSGYPARGEML